jgi:hypothetical protein
MSFVLFPEVRVLYKRFHHVLQCSKEPETNFTPYLLNFTSSCLAQVSAPPTMGKMPGLTVCGKHTFTNLELSF